MDREKRRAWEKAYYQANKHRWYKKPKGSHFLRKYGITPEQYDAQLKVQGGGCAICGARPQDDKRRFPVDHDHVTKRFRGVLCTRCNLGMHFLDDAEWMEKALAYRTSCATISGVSNPTEEDSS